MEWLEKEAAAQMIRAWSPVLLPGLLQTGEYARALFIGAGADDDYADEQVAVRLGRQEILDRPRPPHMVALLDESALRRLIGSPQAMHDALVRVAELAARPNIVVQVVGDFVAGIRYFGQGFGMLARRPRLLLIGMLPAVLTAAILLGGMIALVANIDHLAALVTPFAEDWTSGERLVTRLAAGGALVSAAVLLGLVGFTAVTLVVGGPFYESIAERIEGDLGIAMGHLDLSWWKQFFSGLRDGIVLLLRSLVFTIPLFLAGFLPVVGQIVVPVLVALTTAWFMALEVVAVPFYRRGIGLRHRTAMLRRRRTLALGLGLPAALLCMIPLLAIVVMPVAFAGGVLVALDVLGLAQGRKPRLADRR